jgi:hypothetical protein
MEEVPSLQSPQMPLESHINGAMSAIGKKAGMLNPAIL